MLITMEDSNCLNSLFKMKARALAAEFLRSGEFEQYIQTLICLAILAEHLQLFNCQITFYRSLQVGCSEAKVDRCGLLRR